MPGSISGTDYCVKQWITMCMAKFGTKNTHYKVLIWISADQKYKSTSDGVLVSERKNSDNFSNLIPYEKFTFVVTLGALPYWMLLSKCICHLHIWSLHHNCA